jgi:hypothetical protein
MAAGLKRIQLHNSVIRLLRLRVAKQQINSVGETPLETESAHG